MRMVGVEVKGKKGGQSLCTQLCCIWSVFEDHVFKEVKVKYNLTDVLTRDSRGLHTHTHTHTHRRERDRDRQRDRENYRKTQVGL